MTANITPIFPATPWANTADLTTVSACTTRHPVAIASITATPVFGVSLSPVSANGRRIDKIQVQASSSSITAATVAQTVLIWMSDGTNAYVIDEIAISAQTPSVTAPAFNIYRLYTTLVLPSIYTLWASTTVATTGSTTAIIVTAFGGDY